MKSYFLVSIVFIMSLLSSCQELGNPYTDSVSVKSIQVDTCYYISQHDCIRYGINVQTDKLVSPNSFVEFIFEIGDRSYFVASESSENGKFYLLLNLPVSEYTFDYVANIASTGKCYVSLSGFGEKYEYGEFKYILPSFDAILPKGETFNYKVEDFIAKKGGITKIAFIANSPVKSADQLVRDDVYMVKNQNVLEIHTLADNFVVNEDASWMFGGLESIKTIDFGENFRTQNVTDMGQMFYKCSSLTSLDVSNFDTQNVTKMDWMFFNCSSLTSLDVSNFDTQKVTDMSYMFSDCSNLTSLDVSNFDTQNVTDMGVMFDGCSSLTSLDVSNFDTQKVTDMGSMFNGCSNLTSLDVSNFDTQNVTDMSYMFKGCSSLTSLDVSNFNTQKVTDMRDMFAFVGKLSELDLLNFDFTSKPQTQNMFYYLGSSVVNRPIPIYVTTDGKFYLQGKDDTGINSAYAVLTSVDDSNFEVPGGGEHGDEEWL